MHGKVLCFVAVVATLAAAQDVSPADYGLVAANGPVKLGFFNGKCIRFNATVSVNIGYTYTNAENKTVHDTAAVPVPKDATYAEECTNGSDTQTLSMHFYDGLWKIELTFLNNTDATFNISTVGVVYDTASLPNKETYFPHYNFTVDKDLSGNVLNSTAQWPIHAPSAHTYQCVYGDTRLPVTTDVAVVLKNLHVQAFQQKAMDTWATGSMCDADVSQSDLVPIIVGAALVILLIVVLVGYLVGRARAARQGYASV